MRIVTNNKPRPILSWWELPAKQQALVKGEHDWLFEGERYECECYTPCKGYIYLLSEFMTVEGVKGWEAVAPDSYFSGVILRIAGTHSCIIGRYCAG